MKKAKTNQIRKIKLWEALVPIIFLIVALSFNVSVFGDDSISGSNQIILMLSAALAAIIAVRKGIPWLEVRAGIVEAISATIPAMIILLLIGSLSGTWLLSGVVPTLTYYGLQILHPSIFLFAACIICAVVSLGTGSSWSTIGTIGIALIGIGNAMGLDQGMVAGAIISGAYFGDKMSPLSDTTNLAPAIAGTDLYTHIRYMTLTTIPSFGISLVLFLILGFMHKGAMSEGDSSAILSALNAKFYISPVLLLVPAALGVLVILKVPPIPTLLAGTALGALFALIFQSEAIASVAGATDASALTYTQVYTGIMKSVYGTIQIPTENDQITDLLGTSGMYGMLGTIWLIITAMMFGGTMEKSGLLSLITAKLISYANSAFSLVFTTSFTCIFFNWTASDQYLSIVVPGKMFAKAYEEEGLAPENLSRTLEDSGTVTSVLVPWNTCGAAQAKVLSVATLTYLPFCFFNIISPLMTLLFAFFAIKIKKLDQADKELMG